MYSISSSCCSIGADLTAAAAKPESERLRRAIRALDQIRVPESFAGPFGSLINEASVLAKKITRKTCRTHDRL